MTSPSLRASIDAPRSVLEKIPPSLAIQRVEPWYWKSCWSTWKSGCRTALQFAPPSVDRIASTPPAITALESSGETAITLSYHDWRLKYVCTASSGEVPTPGRSFHLSPPSVVL